MSRDAVFPQQRTSSTHRVKAASSFRNRWCPRAEQHVRPLFSVPHLNQFDPAEWTSPPDRIVSHEWNSRTGQRIITLVHGDGQQHGTCNPLFCVRLHAYSRAQAKVCRSIWSWWHRRKKTLVRLTSDNRAQTGMQGNPELNRPDVFMPACNAGFGLTRLSPVTSGTKAVIELELRFSALKMGHAVLAPGYSFFSQAM